MESENSLSHTLLAIKRSNLELIKIGKENVIFDRGDGTRLKCTNPDTESGQFVHRSVFFNVSHCG